jgi:hypothetical protein
MKIVINCCFGGFGLSREAVMLYAKKKGFELCPFTDKGRNPDGTLDFHKFVPCDGDDGTFLMHYTTKPLKNGKYQEGIYLSPDDIERTDPILVEVVQELGDKASGRHANLKIIEIPDGIEYEIDEYDGIETVHEAHRSWS